MVSYWSSVCLFVLRPPVFSFPDDKLSKYYPKLGMYIDIMELWFRFGQILSIFDGSSYWPTTHCDRVLSFPVFR